MDSLNNRIAKTFSKIADSLEILDENRFKINAYRKASRNISSMTDSLEDFRDERRLAEIPGVGKDLSKKIIEYVKTGQIAYYEELRKRVPDHLVELLEIRGVGPKLLQTLIKRFGVTDIKSLKETIVNPDILEVRGIGRKKIGEILRSIETFEGGKRRMRLTEAHILATLIKEELEEISEVVLQTQLAGSLRRMRETVGNLDILVSTEEKKKVIEEIKDISYANEILKTTENGVEILTEAKVKANFLVVSPARFGSALQKFTGSRSHNEKINKLAAEAGLETDFAGICGRGKCFSSERDVYESLGLDYIPPEIREDLGEIEAASAGNLPSLLEKSDIKGDLHTHSIWSDGTATVREMASKASSLGYEYVAITDHSPSSRIANGLSLDRLWRKKKEIEKINAEWGKIKVLMGSEVDILPDGSLDYPDEVLRELDFVIASVHASFSMEEDKMTRRICRAIENPNVDAIAHPTGRLIGQREPYKVDIDAVIEAARRHGKALEINSSRKRLDLKDVHVKKAVSKGVKLIVSTDAHRTQHLERINFGVGTARRGWAKKTDVVNTYGLNELLTWLASHNR